MDSPGKRSDNSISAKATQEIRPDERFPKSARLHSSLEFDDLFARGKVLADPTLVMHSRPAQPERAGRIGISISKRVGHAPLRNRWKRLIREAYRRQVRRTPALIRLDLVVRPRRGAVPNYTAIEHSLTSLATRLDKQWHR
jgi:ribonuclease P protein component